VTYFNPKTQRMEDAEEEDIFDSEEEALPK
jgi:hypothetical protein